MSYECFLKADNMVVDNFVGAYNSLSKAKYHSKEIIKALKFANKDIPFFIAIRESKNYRIVEKIQGEQL